MAARPPACLEREIRAVRDRMGGCRSAWRGGVGGGAHHEREDDANKFCRGGKEKSFIEASGARREYALDSNRFRGLKNLGLHLRIY